MEVIADILARREQGVKKYGTELKTNNGRSALVDAYQESLDLAHYLKQALMEESGRVTKRELDILMSALNNSYVFISKSDSLRHGGLETTNPETGLISTSKDELAALFYKLRDRFDRL